MKAQTKMIDAPTSSLPKLKGIFQERKDELQELHPFLAAWYGAETAAIHGSLYPQRKGILLSAPIWGEKWMRLFTEFCLPSILASGPALKDWAHLLLFVDGENLIPMYQQLEPLHERGIEVILRPIPSQVIELSNRGSNNYWTLGTAENLGVHWAGAYGLGFHPLKPDHIFNKDYFSSLRGLTQTEDAVVQITISATMEKALPLLAKHRKDGLLAMSARDLGDMAWRNLHPRMGPMVMNNASIPDDVPEAFQMIWRGKDRLELGCCHVNPMWLNPKACRTAPAVFPATLDARAPWYLPENFYQPGAEDGLTFIELTGEHAKPNDIKRGPFLEFAEHCWTQAGFKEDYVQLFGLRSHVPIHAGDNDYLEADEIERQHKDVIKRLYDAQNEIAKRTCASVFGGRPTAQWAMGVA